MGLFERTINRTVERLRRPQGVPWRSAGLRTESLTAEEAVRSTGWVFDNQTRDVSLSSFAKSGEKEVRRYLKIFGYAKGETATLDMVEIGSGIGRMTAGFTKRFHIVHAADVDAAFLERCRETVFQFGDATRLRALHVRDGRSLDLPAASVDLAFSYITLQHCKKEDAAALVGEALRVTRSGGMIALNFRTWTRADVALVPLGAIVRLLWRAPKVAKYMARVRMLTRLGWQANRLTPDEVFDAIGGQRMMNELRDVRIMYSPRRSVRTRHPNVRGVPVPRVHRSHWWLVARLA